MLALLNLEPCLPSEIHDSEGQRPFHRGTLNRLTGEQIKLDVFLMTY